LACPVFCTGWNPSSLISSLASKPFAEIDIQNWLTDWTEGTLEPARTKGIHRVHFRESLWKC
jgi:hypothetical protein